MRTRKPINVTLPNELVDALNGLSTSDLNFSRTVERFVLQGFACALNHSDRENVLDLKKLLDALEDGKRESTEEKQ